MMLYESELPAGQDIPSLDFLNEPTLSPSQSISSTPSASACGMPIATTSDIPNPTQTSDGTTTVPFSLFIRLLALFTSVLVY